MSYIIDAHNHAGIRHGACQTGEQLVAKMDKVGVDKAVIFPFTEGDFTNDSIHEYAQQFPDRLIPYCSVNPWNTKTALKELEMCLGKLEFKGIKLHPTLHGFHLSDPQLVNPIFDIAEQFHVPIISHGAADLFNCPAEFAIIAKRFPKVNLLMAHCGFFWSVDHAIEFAKEIPNLYLEASRVPVFELSEVVKKLGPEKLIWGTDSPFVDYEWEYKKMERVSDSKEAHDLIVGGNIARLLGLD
jgi:predicted TIM-barrel fold metal-dependent hydrolase